MDKGSVWPIVGAVASLLELPANVEVLHPRVVSQTLVKRNLVKDFSPETHAAARDEIDLPRLVSPCDCYESRSLEFSIRHAWQKEHFSNESAGEPAQTAIPPVQCASRQ